MIINIYKTEIIFFFAADLLGKGVITEFILSRVFRGLGKYYRITLWKT